MNTDKANRARPGFLILLGLLAITMVVVGWYALRKPTKNAVVQTEETVVAPVTPVPVVAAKPHVQPSVDPSMPKTVEQQWGIQVASVALAMQGVAVDIQYTVVDPEKALQLAEGTAKIYLIDTASGQKIYMPSVAETKFNQRTRAHMMRQSGSFPPSPNRLTAGNTNSILLPNPAGLLKTGSEVMVMVGDAQAANIIVQ